MLQFRSICERGRRNENEDHVFCSTNDSAGAQSLFIVCDGVGGAPAGAKASELACTAIAAYLKNNKNVSKEDIKAAVQHAIDVLKEYVQDHGSSKGMATTLALLLCDNNRATIAHIGDSRVYHIRNGKIVFRTSDHSLVNDLIYTGYISEVEAMHHPKRNVITRAINANPENATPEIHITSDIQDGDYFLVCSDGVIEGIGDVPVFIKSYFKKNASPADLLAVMASQCNEFSKDNYTAIIIRYGNN